MSTKKVPAKKAASGHNSEKSSQKPSPSKPKTPDSKDVIDLATRLVSAQIMANSYHDTASCMLREIGQMASDMVNAINGYRRITSSESREPHGQLGLPSGSMISQSFHNRLIPRSRMLDPMSHRDLDHLFQSAMRRAYVMLNAPYDPERIVFSEQIFCPFEDLTEGAIRQRFIEYSWPGLKSGTSVNKLMRDINRWFLQHLVDLSAQHQSLDEIETINATDPNISIHTRIEVEVKRLSWLLSQVDSEKGLDPDTTKVHQNLSQALSAYHELNDGTDIAGVFRSLDATERKNLISIMFNPNGPQAFPKKSCGEASDAATSNGKNEPSLTFRPWAIFRYLRKYGNEAGDQLGKDLNRRNRAKRSELIPEKIPDISGIEPVEFHFGPLHEDVEERLEQLQREGAYSDIAENSNELELHGIDAEDLPSGASDLGNPHKDIPSF